MSPCLRALTIAAYSALTVSFAGNASASLIAHYSFDGAVTADSSGNGRTLTTGSGGPTQVVGQFGNAANFAGAGFLYSADSAFNIGTGNFAISLWYQASESLFSPLVGKNSSSSNAGYAVSQSTILAGDVGDTTGGAVATARPGDDLSVFHHIVFQQIGTTLEFYLDGILADTFSGATGSDSSNAFAIGSRNITSGGVEGSGGGTSQKFNGLMDEVFVFDNALSQTEISNLQQFNSLDAPAVPEPGILAIFCLGLFGMGYIRRRTSV
ncbi:MAG: PEP-CTERM sorting domain-containing protein [Alphaproteobacteria bacterium]|nr:PEP-CTERM sorting domain-containing protein [Alphaproteobacteria bacterium]